MIHPSRHRWCRRDSHEPWNAASSPSQGDSPGLATLLYYINPLPIPPLLLYFFSPPLHKSSQPNPALLFYSTLSLHQHPHHLMDSPTLQYLFSPPRSLGFLMAVHGELILLSHILLPWFSFPSQQHRSSTVVSVPETYLVS